MVILAKHTYMISRFTESHSESREQYEKHILDVTHIIQKFLNLFL